MVDIPLHSLVVLVGTAGSGKQSWAEQNFPSRELLSAETIRKELFGRADNHQHDGVVWRELYRRAELKLSLGSRVVVVATNLKKGDRDPFAKMAVDYGVPCFFVKFESSSYHKTEILKKRGLTESQARAVVTKQEHTFKSNSKSLVSEPNSKVTVVGSDLVGQIAQNHVVIKHRLLVVGDVHGDYHSMQRAVHMAEKEDRIIVWLGDVLDYGDQNLKCVKLAYNTVMNNRAVFVWGNHERKIGRWINDDWGQLYRGRISEANLCTIREIQKLNGERRKRFLAAWMALENQSQQCWVVDNWMFTHGAATPQMWNWHRQHRLSNPDGEMAFFGQTDRSNPTRSDGYPNRIWDWVESVPPNHNVVVGHDWVDRITNSVVIKTNSQGGTVYCVDAGNSKGGRLAALAIDTQTQQVEERYFDT